MCIICLDTDSADVLICVNGHGICTDCIGHGIKICIAEHILFVCSQCKQRYEFDEILDNILVDSDIKNSYNQVKLELQLYNLHVDLYKCPFCTNQVSFYESNIDTAFDCLECKKKSCMKCKKDYHENDCETDENTKKTMDYVITCCNKMFIRHDACNYIECPDCKQPYCWICKSKIKKAQHHNGHFGTNKCPLFGERIEDRDDPSVQRARLQGAGGVNGFGGDYGGNIGTSYSYYTSSSSYYTSSSY